MSPPRWRARRVSAFSFCDRLLMWYMPLFRKVIPMRSKAYRSTRVNSGEPVRRSNLGGRPVACLTCTGKSEAGGSGTRAILGPARREPSSRRSGHQRRRSTPSN